ncbi:MAG: hypothetical protein ACRC6A_06925 [Fusobacteriaceae bacterium]
MKFFYRFLYNFIELFLQTSASAVISSEFKKTIAGISRSIPRDVHRCNRTRFLNNSPLDDNQLKSSRLSNSMNNLVFEANTSKKSKPIFVSIDDTLIKVYLGLD